MVSRPFINAGNVQCNGRFLHLEKRINAWILLDEEDFLISFFDFLDYYTSYEFDFSLERFEEELEEELIYNYNVGADLKEISFKTLDGEEFIIGGVSLVRRGNQVTMLFLTGQVTDTKKITQKIKSESTSFNPVKGKEGLSPAKDLEREAVMLYDDPNLWKVLIACRFDLEEETLDVRYVAKDKGNMYDVITDDADCFKVNGKWRHKDGEENL